MKTLDSITDNIWKLYTLNFLRELIFFIPILVPFWSEFFSMRQIFILEASYSAMLLIFEIPSGYFADIFGRKKSLIVGSLLGSIGIGLFVFSSSFTGFLIGEIVIGLGASFISGAEEALTYETLLQSGRADRYKKVQGNMFLSGRIASIFSNVTGGFLAMIFLRFPFYVSLIPFFLAFLLSLTLREPQRHVEKFETLAHFKKILRETAADKKLFLFLIFAAIPPGFFLMSFWLYQKYMQFVELPLSYFGIVIAVMSITSGIGSKFAQEIEAYFGVKISLILVPVFAITVWFLLGNIKSLYAVLLFPVTSFLWGFFLPVFQDSIQKMVGSDRRATILSIRSFGTRGIFFLLGPFLGYVVDFYDIQSAFLITAILMAVLIGVSLIGLRRVKIL